MEENNNQAAATDTTQVQDQVDDWGGAEADFLADKGVKPDEQTKSEKTYEEKAAEALAAKDKKPDEEQGAGDDSKKGAGSEEETDPNADKDLEQGADDDTPQGVNPSDYRRTMREIEADNKAMQADVQKELYPDWSDTITDDEGDPIKTPADVMKHINPVTKKRFTEEEATAWLFAAQEHKDKQRTEMQERVQQVAEVMIEQRDQADQVKSKYGSLLAKLPELRKEIWADYKATLVVDKETGLIVDAPVSLYKFFARALRPYEQYVKQIQTDTAATKPPAQTDAQRKQTHQDREDIHSAGGGSVEDPEEAGWSKAAKEYYEGK